MQGKENLYSKFVPCAIEIVYQKPLIITKKGHYSGNYRGTKDSAAVWIQTTDSVWLDNVNLQSDAGEGLKMSGGTKVTVTNLKVDGMQPTGAGQYGRAIDNYMPSFFKMKGFEINNTGGILIDHNKTGVSPLIQMYYGYIRNTTNLKGDGTLGKTTAGMQFNTVVNMNPASEAAWIEWYNEPGKSSVEDNFNFYNSSNFKLHDFFIHGAYPYPASGAYYSGSGVTSDGSLQYGNNRTFATHNLEVWNGIIVSTMNAAANIAAGYNVNFHDLTILSSGLLPDGTKGNKFWSGACIFNGNHYPDSIFGNNQITGCTIGYVNNGNENYPYKGRQDENKDRNVNKMPVGGNTFLPDRPITLAMEDSVYGVWKAKVAAAGVTLGLQGASVTPPVQTPTPSPLPPVIAPVDTTKKTIVIQHDTVIISHNDTFRYFITEKRVTVGYDTLIVKTK